MPEVRELSDQRFELPRLDHLRAMMSPAGVVQFAQGAEPDISSGTCLDDNARALLVAVMALAADPSYPHAREVGDSAAAFIARARRPDDTFHNFADIDGRFLDDVGSEDSFGRMIWACGVAARCAALPEWRAIALATLEAALPSAMELRHNHSRAYALLGATAAIAPDLATDLAPAGPPLGGAMRASIQRLVAKHAGSLDDDFRSAATPDWSWWKPSLTWGNARMPEALLRAAAATGERRYAESGMRALEFLAGITQSGEVFIPIGNAGWYTKGAHRAKYDQQPIEACAMVDAWLAAHRLDGDAGYRGRATTAFEWFLGRNTDGLALARPQTGGCCDGLRRGRVNENQGAESTLSYLHASLAIRAR